MRGGHRRCAIVYEHWKWNIALQFKSVGTFAHKQYFRPALIGSQVHCDEDWYEGQLGKKQTNRKKCSVFSYLLMVVTELVCSDTLSNVVEWMVYSFLPFFLSENTKKYCNWIEYSWKIIWILWYLCVNSHFFVLLFHLLFYRTVLTEQPVIPNSKIKRLSKLHYKPNRQRRKQ